MNLEDAKRELALLEENDLSLGAEEMALLSVSEANTILKRKDRIIELQSMVIKNWEATDEAKRNEEG